MHFEHNEERDKYLEARGKLVLNACPGSGKTTTIAYKLYELHKSWDSDFGKYAGVACLSFTNVAKDEINEKYLDFSGKSIGYPHIVSTIDSFINQYITLPFYNLFYEGFDGRPSIVDDPGFMNNWRFFGYRLPGKKGGAGGKPIQFSYCPSAIDLDSSGTFTFAGKRPSLPAENIKVFDAYSKALKKTQFSNGLLKNSDSTFVALQILRANPIVAQLLVRRFPYIIVDEAQDTSEIQFAIFDELIKNGLERIELVGDPYQSLYEWRAARPDLFEERCESTEWKKLELTHCRRSTSTIVDCYRRLRKEADASIYSSRETTDPEKLRVIRYANSESLLARYRILAKQYKLCKILVRGKTHLKQFCAQVKSDSMWKIEPCLPEHLIFGRHELGNGNVRDAVRRIRRCIPALLKPGSKIDEQKRILEEIEKDPIWNARIMDLLSKIPENNLTVAEWTNLTQDICRELLKLDYTPDFELKRGTCCPKHSKRVGELYSDAPNSSLVVTIHSVKGKTFDSVMLVLNKNSSGQSISIADFVKPALIPGEKTRMVYVAMSRPRDQLIIAVPLEAAIADEQLKEHFGEELVIEDLNS